MRLCAAQIAASFPNASIGSGRSGHGDADANLIHSSLSCQSCMQGIYMIQAWLAVGLLRKWYPIYCTDQGTGGHAAGELRACISAALQPGCTIEHWPGPARISTNLKCLLIICVAMQADLSAGAAGLDPVQVACTRITFNTYPSCMLTPAAEAAQPTPQRAHDAAGVQVWAAPPQP